MEIFTSKLWLEIGVFLFLLTSCKSSDRETMADILHKGHPSNDLQILYSDDSDTYQHLVKDSVTDVVINGRIEIDEKTYSPLIDSAMSIHASPLLPSRYVDHELVLTYLRQHLTDLPTIERRLRQIENIRSTLDTSQPIGRYYDLQYHAIAAEQLFEQGRNVEALSYAYEGLYQLSQKQNASLKPLLWDRFISTAFTIGSRENNSRPYVLQNQNLNNQRLDTTGISKGLSEMFLADDYNDQALTLRSRIDTLSNLLKHARTKADSVKIHLNLGVYLELAGDTTAARTQYRYACSIYPPDACCRLCQIASDYLVELGGEAAFDMDATCPDFLKFNFSSYSVNSLADILHQRAVANEVFGGRSTLHLQDFYLENTRSILKSIRAADNRDSLLVAIFADTRTRERYRQISDWNTTAETLKATNIYGEINNLLLKTKSFTAVLPLDDPSYHELYLSLKKLDKNTSANVQRPPTVDLATVEEVLQMDNLYNVLQIHDTYHYYKVDGEQATIGKIKASDWAVLSDSLMHLILTKDDATSPVITATRRLLESSGWDLSRPMTLITDGGMLTFPWELVTNHPVRRFTSIDQLLATNRQVVTTAALASYSDEQTLATRDALTYVELAASPIEVSAIASFLDNPTVITGYDLTAASIEDMLSRDLLHIATHAVASSDNRLDNYLVVRDDLGRGVPYYAYRFAQATEVPKVAILSSCYSGTGTYVSGAGVFSLAKVLQAAGCGSVVKSLWAVDDVVTKDLMVALYQHWSTGIHLIEALDHAKEDIRHHSATHQPYYWAGFVLEGNDEVHLNDQKTIK